MSYENRKIEKFNWFLIFEMLSCTLIVWFNCTNKHDLASTCFAISFIILLVEFVKYLFSKLETIDAVDLLMLFIVCLSFFISFTSLFSSGKGVNFENLKQWIFFICTVIFMRLAEKIRISRNTANIIFGFNILISLIYIYSKRFHPQVYLYYGFNGLTLNFSNPNLAGMFIFISLLYMFLGCFYFKKLLVRIICAVLAISNFSLLLQTESRNPLLAFVLFLVIFFLSLLKINLRFSNFFTGIVNIAPSLFVFLYLTFISTIMEKGWLNFLVSEGKNLNSRVKVWKSFLSRLGSKWLIGDYSELAGNAHNTHMVILCSFGLIVLILTIVLTYRITKNISRRIENRFQLYCLSAFFAILFMGFGEGALYSGGMGLHLMCGNFIVLANSKLDKRRNSENERKLL